MSLPTGQKAGSRPKKAVGRRVFIGIAALDALGVAVGGDVQNFLGNAFGSGLGGILPGSGSTRSPANTRRSAVGSSASK
jgi:hypothetical protein